MARKDRFIGSDMPVSGDKPLTTVKAQQTVDEEKRLSVRDDGLNTRDSRTKPGGKIHRVGNWPLAMFSQQRFIVLHDG